MFSVIFSRNRACQLDLCLRKIKENVKEWEQIKWTVLYSYSDENFGKGYENVIKEHPEFIFVKESHFKEDVCRIFRENSESEYMFFLCDDDYIRDEFTIFCDEFERFRDSDTILSLSLRMYSGIIRSYTQNCVCQVPEIIDGVWNWSNCNSRHDWGYPLSVEGNIYKVDDIIEMVEGIEYYNPNTFEATMDMNRHYVSHKPHMLCFNNSKLINVPLNRVQNTFSNISQNCSVDKMNNLYLEGYRLNGPLKIRNISPHFEVPMLLKNGDRVILPEHL